MRLWFHLRNEIKFMGVTTNLNELLLSCAMPVCCSQSLLNRCVKSFGKEITIQMNTRPLFSVKFKLHGKGVLDEEISESRLFFNPELTLIEF